MRRDTGGRLRGVVLDLRNNPGGLLDQAIEVSDTFLDGGEVVSTRGRQAQDVQRYNARRGDELPRGANRGAGERALRLRRRKSSRGALQDRNRALLVGTTSFGKGSVQTVIPLQAAAMARCV